MQYNIFSVGGAKTPPDFALEAKKKTHEVVLERDLGQKITSGQNLANKDLSEIYRAEMEGHVLALAREDPNLEGPAEKAVEAEIGYFDQIISATEDFRRSTKPLKVEEPLKFELGGVPISCRLDLIEDETIAHRVVDLKRQGQAPAVGSASLNRQLVTYAVGTGLSDVGLVAVVENKKPVVKRDSGEVTQGEVGRVTAQYQAVASQIDHAMTTGIFSPVDHGDSRKAWICSARFCGAWRIGAKDWLTGRDISCPFGERSSVSVSIGG